MKEFPIQSILSVITNKMFCTEAELKSILEYLCSVSSIHTQNLAAANNYASLVLVRQLSNGLKWLERIDSKPFEMKAMKIQMEASVGAPETIQDSRDVSTISKIAEASKAKMDALVKSFIDQAKKLAKKDSFPLANSSDLGMKPFDHRFITNWWLQFQKDNG
jgi:hypothetical protein